MFFFVSLFFTISLTYCKGREVSAFLTPSSTSPSSTASTRIPSFSAATSYRYKNNKDITPRKIETSATSSLMLSSTNQQKDGKNVDNLTLTADTLFDSIDENDDGGISNSELQTHLESVGYSSKSIRYLFTALDKNADGKISREELRYAFSNYEISALYSAFGLDSIPKKNEEPSDADKRTREAAIDQLRHNEAINEIRSDSKIDRKTNPAMLIRLADMIFSEVDTDNNGVIDKEELRECLYETNTIDDSCNLMDFPQKIQDIFTALDLDGDGTISRQEMRDGFTQYDHRALSKAFGFAVARRSEV